jgi:hypothetical protein
MRVHVYATTAPDVIVGAVHDQIAVGVGAHQELVYESCWAAALAQRELDRLTAAGKVPEDFTLKITVDKGACDDVFRTANRIDDAVEIAGR